MHDQPHVRPRPERLFTFGSAGWVLLLTAVLAVVILAMTLGPALAKLPGRAPGDGRDPTTYGFDLSTCLVPRETLVAGQLHRDIHPLLVDPATMPGASVTAHNREHYGKYLVPGDRVIGVEIAGEARAYPLMIMKLHEAANDSLGGRPILVTYNPLCDSAIVFDRAAVSDDPADPVQFGVSGLLYNSNLLLYDRRPGAESLWSQLQARAVTGPAAEAGRRLEIVPAVLVQWGHWLAAHPDTTVLVPDVSWLRRYQETNYATYFDSGELLFPVDPAAPEDGPPAKTRCVVVPAGAGHRVYPMPLVRERAMPAGKFRETVGERTLTFRYAQDPETVEVTADDGPVPVVYSFWFAWHAMHPESVPER